MTDEQAALIAATFAYQPRSFSESDRRRMIENDAEWMLEWLRARRAEREGYTARPQPLPVPPKASG